MTEERREARRVRILEEIEASIGGAKVLILELSTRGAHVEHDLRFSLAAPHLSIKWRDRTITIPVRVARSEIAGRRDSRLIYQSGIFFTEADPLAEEVVESIIREAELRLKDASPAAAAQRSSRSEQSFDDSWIRTVNALKREPEDGLPYVQFRLTEFGWQKAYVANPTQPDDGFTILRGHKDTADLQRTFEKTDPTSRRLLQASLKAKLKG